MTRIFYKFQLVIIMILCSHALIAQSQDTLVDVGSYKLHFNIIGGEGIPILFEAGSGNDASIWKEIVTPIAEITGTTIITYDRAGLGTSEIKSEKISIEANGIASNVNALEIGLQKLGFNGAIIIVAHSLGGFYATLFAARNEQNVKHVVLIDASLPLFYTEVFLDSLNGMISDNLLDRFRQEKLGLYYEVKNIENTIKLIEETVFPTTIPVMDLVADEPYNPLKNEIDKNRWKSTHQDFVNGASNRELITINDASHYAFKDNPIMVINAIVKAFASIKDDSANRDILLRTLDFALKNSNKKTKK